MQKQKEKELVVITYVVLVLGIVALAIFSLETGREHLITSVAAPTIVVLGAFGTIIAWRYKN